MERKPYLTLAGDLTALAALPPKMRLAGIDPGRRRIGLALSDSARQYAMAHSVLTRTKLAEDMKALHRFALEWEVGGFVLGLPLTMAGKEGRQAQSVRDFARQLAQHTGLPLAFEDERLSTKGAEKLLADLPRSGAVKRAALDAEAAAGILQTALMRLGGGRPPLASDG